MADVHFHIERPGPRPQYIISHLLGRMAGWEAHEVASREELGRMDGPKLIYGHAPMEGAFQVRPTGLLEGQGHLAEDPEVRPFHGVPTLFPINGGDLPFDIFSASFFLLSRMEEYGPVAHDAHGRPVSAALHGVRHGYAHRPVVDEWLLQLAGAWRERDPRLPPLHRTYAHTATLDVDNGAMYRGREWWRSAGSAARDLFKGRPARVWDRLAVLAGKRPDPYAIHQRLLGLAEDTGARAIVNFMATDRGAHDHAIPIDGPYMRAVVKGVAERARIGLHPGYATMEEPERIRREKARLESVAGMAVTISRQHFLRFRLPETMRGLVRWGIREDHSMGFADRTGFRAGTCTAYPFFDIVADAALPLMIHPFAVMDSAMAYRMKCTPREAVAEACRLADTVRAVQGTFISVWHERFLSGYGDEQGWGAVADDVLDHARP